MSTVTQDRDAAAVVEVVTSYGDRLRAGDVAGIVGLFTADAIVLAPDLDVSAGSEALAAVYRSALDAIGMDFDFEVIDISVWGDTAVACTRSSGATTVHATGDRTPLRFRELFVLRRDGAAWRIARYMFQPEP